MRILDITKYPCPKCGSRHPDWSRHAFYGRYLISFENGQLSTHRITIPRYMCSSCSSTHAILPELIIPYRSYSLIIILTVLREFYVYHATIQSICDKYKISVATFYEWKKLFLIHKKQWLGLLEDYITKPSVFLADLLSKSKITKLRDFFTITYYSFLQGGLHITATSIYMPP